jgi:hypothetical protein
VVVSVQYSESGDGDDVSSLYWSIGWCWNSSCLRTDDDVRTINNVIVS